jgi:hypothetical protein
MATATGSMGARWARRAAAATVVLLGGVLAGCVSPRDNLGTSDSPCYLAIPAATRAVHGHGRFLGVHLLTLRSLRKESPVLYRSLGTARPLTQQVCVVAFSGRFDASGVSAPKGKTSGRTAVVVETIPSVALVGTVIYAHTPFRFGHAHFG